MFSIAPILQVYTWTVPSVPAEALGVLIHSRIPYIQHSFHVYLHTVLGLQKCAVDACSFCCLLYLPRPSLLAACSSSSLPCPCCRSSRLLLPARCTQLPSCCSSDLSRSNSDSTSEVLAGNPSSLVFLDHAFSIPLSRQSSSALCRHRGENTTFCFYRAHCCS